MNSSGHDNQIEIKGIGVLGGFGCGITDLLKAIAENKTCPGSVNLETADETISMPVFLADTSALENYISKKELRRIDHCTRMALLGAYMALEDADMLQTNRNRMGIIVATGYGATRTTFDFLDSFMDDGDVFSSPIKFSNSVHNAPAAHISIFISEHGPNLTVSQFEMSFSSALITACVWLKENRVDSVLVGGVDEYCQVLGYCWNRLITKKQSQKKDGSNAFEHIVGEGSVFFLLTRSEGKNSRYGIIEDVKLGNIEHLTLNHLTLNTFLILNDDGYSLSKSSYEKLIGKDTPKACYTHLYGSIPVGQAFDLSIAALNDYFPDKEPICCLKLGCWGEYSMITLRKGCNPI